MTMTAPLDASALSALEQAARAATPGPWERKEHVEPNGYRYPELSDIVTGRRSSSGGFFHADAAFIAAAHPGTVLALIAEVRALRAALLETCEDIARQGGGTAEWWRDRLVVDARKALESGA